MASSLKNLVKGSLLLFPLPEMMVYGRSRRCLTIFAYHRIRESAARGYPFDAELISASPPEFQRELHYIRKHFDLMTVAELERGIKEPRTLPARPAAITFDDGYADNYITAFPLLKEAGLSACFFLSTHIVGTSNIPWWDQASCCFKNSSVPAFASPFGGREEPYSCEPSDLKAETKRYLQKMKARPWPDALKYLDALKEITRVNPSDYITRPLFLSWDNAREMLAGGMEIGGHTRSHPILGKITDAELLKAEIQGCRADLIRELNLAPTAFSYPEGTEQAMSEAADAVIRQAGFSISFSYLPFLARRRSNSVSRIPRFHAEFGADFGSFRLSLGRARIASSTLS